MNSLRRLILGVVVLVGLNSCYLEEDSSNGSEYATKSKYLGFLRTEGTKIVDEEGVEFTITGINLGNWLLWEGYLMMGDFNYRTHTQFLESLEEAFGDKDKAEEFEHQWRLNYVTEVEIEDLSDLGFNCVRVPFHYNMFWDEENDSGIDTGFEYIDNLISYCKNYEIYILLDMHAAPGYQNPGDHCDNLDSDSSQPRDSVKFWDGENVEIAGKAWAHIAEYYKDEEYILGYDLINEPVPQDGREYELLPSLIEIASCIREVDSNHIIVAEGSWWASDMTKLDWSDSSVQSNSNVDNRWDTNLVYQTHHYSDDVSLLNERVEITDDLEVPLILGEYGENSNDILREMTEWCIDNNVGYFPWSFKKMSHDRCLWTITPDDSYEELKSFINGYSAISSDIYESMIDFCINKISNDSDNVSWDQDFYDAIKR